MISGYYDDVYFDDPNNMYEVYKVTFGDGTKGVSIRLRDTTSNARVCMDLSADSAKKFVEFLNKAVENL